MLPLTGRARRGCGEAAFTASVFTIELAGEASLSSGTFSLRCTPPAFSFAMSSTLSDFRSEEEPPNWICLLAAPTNFTSPVPLTSDLVTFSPSGRLVLGVESFWYFSFGDDGPSLTGYFIFWRRD